MRDLTTDQLEAAYELADDYFAIMLRISEGEHLYFLADGQNTVYTHTVNALTLLLRQLGAHPADLNDIMSQMGEGTPSEEAIAEARAEREKS